ncbi:hypothetical protein B566_EDAN004233 [Ephemera danica]|nr:hypothetical protein B566_EDAN004233 [Ephemera danica]
MVLVEYDDVEWQRREWLSLHKGRVFHAFLVEHSLVWAPRASSSSAPLWPALTFAPLVDNAQLTDAPLQPIEFLGDLELTFRSDVKNLVPFQMS